MRGANCFEGISFHSSQWNHSVDLSGKTVSVIGNAASAAQIIPEIAPKVAQLNVLQRSANYHLLRGDFHYPSFVHTLFSWFPILAWLYQCYMWLIYGDLILYSVMKQRWWAVPIAQAMWKANLNSSIKDPELRKKLTPTTPIGFKRILFTDDYYPTFNRKNVSLVTEKIDSIVSNGIRLVDGSILQSDIIIYATGFRSTDYLFPMKVVGKNGVVLNELWKKEARAYLGITVSGFPNLFVLYGPNTNLGHGSIICALEAQVGYICDIIRTFFPTLIG
jgi:cation diffusion facilitator CzcD-associated flavoprotein CzcO